VDGGKRCRRGKTTDREQKAQEAGKQGAECRMSIERYTTEGWIETKKKVVANSGNSPEKRNGGHARKEYERISSPRPQKEKSCLRKSSAL